MTGQGGGPMAPAAPGDYVYFKSVVPLHEISDTKTSEAPSSSKTTSKASSGSTNTNVSPVTEDEIRTVLAVAPVTTQDLVSRFKSRLRDPEDKNAFSEILKKICKIQKTNGHNYVVLREDKK